MLVALVIVVVRAPVRGRGFHEPVIPGLTRPTRKKSFSAWPRKTSPYQLSSDGTSIDVPADRLDRVRVEMASQNLPHTGRMGFELFDKPNWSSSDFSERVNYQRALEAELERTIETMDTVESARVHLVAAARIAVHQRRAAGQSRRRRETAHAAGWPIKRSTRSPIWSPAPGKIFLPTMSRSSVPTGACRLTAGKSERRRAPRLADLETTMAERIVDTLAPVVGADHVKSSVTIEYNPEFRRDHAGTLRSRRDRRPDLANLAGPDHRRDCGQEFPGTPSNVPSPRASCRGNA